MPVQSIRNSVVDPEWSRANPDLMQVFQTRMPLVDSNGFLVRAHAALSGGLHVPTPDSTNTLRRTVALLNARSNEDVAGPYDAWQIPNGVYHVYTGSETYRYNVHLVSEGSLRGQRVLKIWQQGRFKAFAFLTRYGQLKIWSRFASDVDAEYVRIAKALLDQIARVDRTELYSSRTLSSWSTPSMRVEFSPRCMQCNTAIDDGGYPEGYCASCRVYAPDSLIAVVSRQVTPAPQESPNRDRNGQNPYIPVSRSRRSTEREQLMSEINPTLVR